MIDFLTYGHITVLKTVKDWHLVIVISAVMFTMAILSAAVTLLRPDL